VPELPPGSRGSRRESSRSPDSPEGVRALLHVPLGEAAALQLFAREPGAFDDRDEELATLLAAHVRAARERIDAGVSLRRERDRLEEFARVLAHDIRNPLSVAQGGLHLAEETGNTEHFEMVERSLDRIERLIEDALTLARQGTTVGDTERVDLTTVARGAWANVETRDATLEIEASSRLRADRSRLLQVLENLFGNAVDHGGPEVTVRVGTLPSGIYVADDGPGIPEGVRPNVFESGVSTSETGTGFGLAIVKRIVEAHGWTVAAIDPSEREGGGEGGTRIEITGVTLIEE
jgi:signal transduction histidine kinase